MTLTLTQVLWDQDTFKDVLETAAFTPLAPSYRHAQLHCEARTTRESSGRLAPRLPKGWALRTERLRFFAAPRRSAGVGAGIGVVAVAVVAGFPFIHTVVAATLQTADAIAAIAGLKVAVVAGLTQIHHTGTARSAGSAPLSSDPAARVGRGTPLTPYARR